MKLRTARHAEGRGDEPYCEIMALEKPLIDVARKHEPAPDSRVQARIGAMLEKLASAIDNPRGGSSSGYGNDYNEAVKLLEALGEGR